MPGTVRAQRRRQAAWRGSGDGLRIRMYRVGFGECFLLSVPGDDGPAHILIDCGVHPQGDLGLIPDAVADIASECNRHLNLVVATNAHQDHISGFAQCEREFRQFAVDEVWLPWTENHEDAQAGPLREKHFALADTLREHFAASGMAVDGTPGGDALAAAVRSTGNRAALGLLRSGIGGGRVRYVGAGQTFRDAAGINGLCARVLGPPRDEKFAARVDPPSGDRFFKLDSVGGLAVRDRVLPFVDKWAARSVPIGALGEEDKEQLNLLSENSAALAFALNQTIDNTSVVMRLAIRGKNLLFPGDAQVASWESWMNSAQSASILEDLDFLKVAHHGSSTAMPRSALERIRDGFVAMISTQNRPWQSIPSHDLLNRLGEKASAVIRSDSIPVADAKAPRGPKLELEHGSGISLGPFWCDYTIRL